MLLNAFKFFGRFNSTWKTNGFGTVTANVSYVEIPVDDMLRNVSEKIK